MTKDMPLTLDALRDAYESGVTPSDIVREVYRRIEEVDDPAILQDIDTPDDLSRFDSAT